MDAHKNFAYSTVLTAPSPATSGTSLVLASGGGAKMPAAPFNGNVWPTGAQPLDTNAEVVRVTLIAGDTLTIVRQQEGSAARTIVVGDQFSAAITVKTITDIETTAIIEAEARTIPANRGLYVPGSYRVPAGVAVRINAGGILEVK